jgi:hypothetical protein
LVESVDFLTHLIRGAHGRFDNRRGSRIEAYLSSERRIAFNEDGIFRRDKQSPPSCPALCRASTSYFLSGEDVDGRA